MIGKQSHFLSLQYKKYMKEERKALKKKKNEPNRDLGPSNRKDFLGDSHSGFFSLGCSQLSRKAVNHPKIGVCKIQTQVIKLHACLILCLYFSSVHFSCKFIQPQFQSYVLLSSSLLSIHRVMSSLSAIPLTTNPLINPKFPRATHLLSQTLPRPENGR